VWLSRHYYAAPFGGTIVFKMFLNLSKHPSALWPPAQRAQARELGGEIVDQPFPEVPPEADTGQISEIGAALTSAIAARAPTAAMVQGEFTLAFYIVSVLDLRGIPTYAATTRRVTEITALPDGAFEKKSRFEFVRFRRYSLGS
jgi:hypothetical protein